MTNEEYEKERQYWAQKRGEVMSQQYMIVQAVMSNTWNMYPSAYAKRLTAEVAKMSMILGKLDRE